MACISQETAEFLLTLLEMIEDASPQDIKDICLSGGSDCEIDPTSIKENARRARDFLNSQQRCEG